MGSKTADLQAGPADSPFLVASGTPSDTVVDKLADGQKSVRAAPRLATTLSVEVYSVSLLGAPLSGTPRAGVVLDVSANGLAMRLDGPQVLPSYGLIAGLKHGDQPGWIGLDVKHQRVQADHLHIGCAFGGVAEQVLSPDNLTPRLDLTTLEFRRGLDDATLEPWVRLGVLEEFDWDRIRVCPQCRGLPTYRLGCPQCGSARIDADRLIHHFPCAYVGPVERFQTRDGLQCPKCRLKELVVNSDYEHAAGPYRCRDCSWSNHELEHVAQCLRCQLRFADHEAHEVSLKGYHARRVDVLALAAHRR